MKQIYITVAVAAMLLFSQARASYLNYISDEEDDSAEHGQAPGSASTSCACGWTNKIPKQFGRVVGGDETAKHEYPLMLALIDVENEQPFCGASILTKRHALTAAHCTEPMKDRDLAVIAGAHDLYNADGQESLVYVKETVEHENYNTETYENDIALLILKDSLDFNQHIGPVCMPSQSYALTDNYIKVIGWGKTKHLGAESEVLLKANLRVVPLQECHNAFKEYLEINLSKPTQICTFRRGKDSCQGDSGGPLLWLDKDTNRYVQVALVSQGRECGGDSPAINTDVFAFIDWVKLKIKESNINLEVCQRI